MGGGTWTQNSKCPKLDSWILTYIKVQELRWGILPLAAHSGPTADIIPPKLQVFSFQSNKLKEEVAESSLDCICIERKKQTRGKVHWLTFPTQQVLTFTVLSKSQHSFFPTDTSKGVGWLCVSW